MIGRRIFAWLFGAAAIAPPAIALAAPATRFPFVLIHPDCGLPAFYLRREIKPGYEMCSADAAMLDGSPMPYGAPHCCGSCGVAFLPRIAYIHAVKA